MRSLNSSDTLGLLFNKVFHIYQDKSIDCLNAYPHQGVHPWLSHFWNAHRSADCTKWKWNPFTSSRVWETDTQSSILPATILFLFPNIPLSFQWLLLCNELAFGDVRSKSIMTKEKHFVRLIFYVYENTWISILVFGFNIWFY